VPQRPRRKARFAALLACALAAAAAASGCQKRGERRDEPAGLTLTLLDEGREPRRALRYPDDPPDEQRLSLTLRVSMKAEAPGSPIPPVAMPGLRLLLDVAARRQGSLLRHELTVTDADLTGADAAHPTMVAGMRKGLDSLVGAAAVVSIDERGFQHELSLGLPGGLGPELTQFMEAARIALGDLALPLPDEAIGVGAKWQVERTLDQGGVAVKEKTYYELIAAEGTRVQVRTRTVQSAEGQRAALAGLPPGVSAEVLSLRGAGAGEVEIDLRRLVPTSAREEIETDVSFAIVQGETERVMSLTSTAGLEVQAL